MRIIRFGTFETNSSMVHSLTLCTPEEFKRFEDGELAWDSCEDKFVPAPEGELDEYDVLVSYDGWKEHEYLYSFKQSENINGQDVIAFGWYGTDY